MVHPPEIDAFADRAREYCAWCRSDKAALTPGRLHFEALRALAAVYAAYFDLPATESIESPNPPPLSDAERSEVRRSVSALQVREYWEVFKPTKLEPGDPVIGDIADDFLDTYIDLSDGIWLYEKQHVQAAVWHWRFTFGIHWGRHVTSALRALQGYEVNGAP